MDTYVPEVSPETVLHKPAGFHRQGLPSSPHAADGALRSCAYGGSRGFAGALGFIFGVTGRTFPLGGGWRQYRGDPVCEGHPVNFVFFLLAGGTFPLYGSPVLPKAP